MNIKYDVDKFLSVVYFRPMLATDIDRIAKKIKWPVSDWPKNCYAISVAIYRAKLVPAASCVRYGIWWGPVAEGSPFADRPFSHHGWIELPDRRIYDPTRYVFENVEPYIWIGSYSPDYDIAGQKLNAIFSGAVCPDPVGEPIALTKSQKEILERFIPSIDQRDPDIEQIRWLAHLHTDALGDQAKEVYRILDELDLLVLVPLDNRRYVLENDKLYDADIRQSLQGSPQRGVPGRRVRAAC